jgi:hypothetical protein
MSQSLGVVFGKRRGGAVARLAAAKAGDPDLGPGKRPGEWLQLAHIAAGMARLDAVVETVQPVGCNESVDVVRLRVEAIDGDVVAVFGLADEIKRLLEEPAGFKRRYGDGQAMRSDRGGDHLVLDPEAGRKHGPAEPCGERQASGKIELCELSVQRFGVLLEPGADGRLQCHGSLFRERWLQHPILWASRTGKAVC